MEETHVLETPEILTWGIFFVKDRIDKGEIRIEYCPSLDMLADYFSKPLQGYLFKKFRGVIMGYKHISTLKWTSFEIKERVGFYRNLEYLYTDEVRTPGEVRTNYTDHGKDRESWGRGNM